MNSHIQKKAAIIFSSPPHGSSLGREALDLALSLSDINNISLYFIGDGIFHLLPNQCPQKILMRDYIATFGLLDVYDISNCYACKNDFLEKNLQINLNIIDLKIVAKQVITDSLATNDFIIRF